MDGHKELVAKIAKQVQRFYERKEKFRIYHGSTNTTRQRSLQRNQIVDTSMLNRVLTVDTDRRIALVEPNVPMDALVEATLPHGLVPPVVMEFPGITAGGGFAGMGAESSSFKEGFFNRTTNWVEIVLADGEIIEASETEHEDLFHGAAGSFGTLGVVTLMEIRLLEAKKYVELTYSPVHSVSAALQLAKAECKDPANDFIDGVMLSVSSGVIVTGRLSDGSSGKKVQNFGGAWDPWLHVHAQDIVAKGLGPITELTPLTDYLFRYDRGAFWTGIYAFDYFKVPFNRFFRWALDWYLHTRVMYRALHESGHMDSYIIQDLALPMDRAEEFISYVDKVLKIFPLWLCPIKQSQRPGGMYRAHEGLNADNELWMNIGVWGPGPKDQSEFVRVNRDLERKVAELGGTKWLYATSYYTEEEFWSIYDRSNYDALREKYRATTLPNVYDKVKYKGTSDRSLNSRMPTWMWRTWPFSGLYGVYKTTLGSEYLLARK